MDFFKDAIVLLCAQLSQQTCGVLPADVGTVGGLVLSLLGRIPATGESAAWEGLTLEVVAMDGPRLERVLIHRT